MKLLNFFLILSLLLILARTQNAVLTENNSPWTVRRSLDLSFYNSKLQNPVVFQYGKVTVPRELWTFGLHAVAYRQLTLLYPAYRTFPIKSCFYTVYGPSRIYTFELLNGGGQSVRLFSSVQNNDESQGYQTQEIVSEEAKALINARDANEEQKIDDQHSGFSVIKLSRAYEIPRVALVIKQVTRSYWSQIRSAPLARCLERWERGTYSFRLFFHGVPNWFEYTHLSAFVSRGDEIQVSIKPNLRTSTTTIASGTATPVKRVVEEYLPRVQPIFTVKRTSEYETYSLGSFRSHVGYEVVSQKLREHFGRFEERWISHIQYRLDSEIHYFQLQVRLVPFLVEVDLEAHYYGSSRKASLLQIDEKVFDPRVERKYAQNWNEIVDFNSYRIFREAHQYVLSQFTYLRFYTVKAAYSILHKSGRRVRLVYQVENNFFTPNGEQQFNILVYICDGKFYIDREDFKATNTASSPNNDWVSLFVRIPDVRNHESYPLISKHFIANHWAFWNAHRIEDIRIHNGLHVIRFRNLSPAVIVEDQEKHCVLRIVGSEVRILNNFDWRKVDEKSLHYIRAVDYFGKKFLSSISILINSKITPYGRHFEVCYLNENRVFSNLYLRYVDAEDLITEDEWQGIAYRIDFDEVQLPENPQETVTRWIVDNHNDVIAVVEIKTSSKNAYQCIALTGYQRWSFHVSWVRGQWVLVRKELVNDGYYFITGAPSVHVASCTGYLARLYPTIFVPGWLYSAIEVRNIGYFVFTRVVYRIGSVSYQGVIRFTYGVENSHTLISWDRVRLIREMNDYGYGLVYDWSYGLNSRYFFDYVSTPFARFNESKVEAVVVVAQRNDLLCAFWDAGKCVACYGDHYADNQGVCRKIQDSCLFWQVGGTCSQCSYGWRVDSRGKCVPEVTFLFI